MKHLPEEQLVGYEQDDRTMEVAQQVGKLLAKDIVFTSNQDKIDKLWGDELKSRKTLLCGGCENPVIGDEAISHCSNCK